MCLTWGEDNVSYGFGWAVDDTHIITFETYEDSYGSTITVGNCWNCPNKSASINIDTG